MIRGERCEHCRWQKKRAERVAAVGKGQACFVRRSPCRAPQQDTLPIWSARLNGQDTALSRLKCRFEPGADHQHDTVLKWLKRTVCKTVNRWLEAKLQPIKCNCPVGSCSRRLDGAKPLFSHKRKCKSNPARISIWSLRLVG